MKIGIIVYSHTGTAYAVAQKLQKTLSAKGHSAEIERITQKDVKNIDKRKVELDVKPATDKYDAIIFGAPVWAFSLSPVMEAYLRQTASLKNKKVACFVTKSLPVAWTGGTKAISQMKSIIESKSAKVCGTAIAAQKNVKDERWLDEMIRKISSTVVA